VAILEPPRIEVIEKDLAKLDDDHLELVRAALSNLLETRRLKRRHEDMDPKDAGTNPEDKPIEALTRSSMPGVSLELTRLSALRWRIAEWSSRQGH
jgi:hypothetical protein